MSTNSDMHWEEDHTFCGRHPCSHRWQMRWSDRPGK